MPSSDAEGELGFGDQDEDLRDPPPQTDGGPVPVEVKVVIMSVSAMDALKKTVSVQAFVDSYWYDTRLIGKKPSELDWSTIWHPKPSIQNQDASNSTNEIAVKLNSSKTGKCAYLISFTGQLQVALDMRAFPFDNAIVSLDLSCSSAGQAISQVLLKASVARFAGTMSLEEWSIAGEMPTDKPDVDPRVKVTTGVESFELDFALETIAFKVSRQPGYYMYKSLLLTYFLLFLSFSHYAYDNEDLPSKMDVILNVFLATVAFLLVSSQNLPSLPYLSTLDKVIMSNFSILLLEAILAVVVKVVQGRIDNLEITNADLGNTINLYGMIGTISLCAVTNIALLAPAAHTHRIEAMKALE